MRQTTLPLKIVTKITTVFLFVIVICLAGTSCQSSKSASKRSGASRSQAYYSPSKRKNKSSKVNFRASVTVGKTKHSGKRAGKKESPTYTRTSNKGSKASASVQAQQVIKAARSYTGTPYRYGGTTRKGMDCSGLLCTSFQAIDIQLPRTSQQQSAIGKTVSLRNLEPGDLVFFSDRRSASKITHVGMVTEVHGDDEIIFIHSSTSRGVREDNLFSDYFQRIFVKAVRPF